jgi:transitional endoplasmic reticulum ATPase
MVVSGRFFPLFSTLVAVAHSGLVFRRGKQTVCVVVPDESLSEDSARLPAVAVKNLKVNPDQDRIVIKQFADIKNAKRVHVLPFKDCLQEFTGDVFETFLKPYFWENYRPVHAGEVFPVHNEELDITVDFKVMQIDDEDTEFAVVAPESVVYTEGEPLDRLKDDPARSEEIGYDDIGGLSKQISQLRELVELPLRHPEIFSTIGAKPPRGVLLHGPPGCGKTMIGKALATESGAFFFLINGPEVLSGKAGDSESHLRRCFEEATKNAPSIIWIDEVDVIAGKRDKANGEVEKRIVSQLITLMDGISNNVMVVAATSKPNNIDTSLRRFGRFSKEIEVVSPDDKGR